MNLNALYRVGCVCMIGETSMLRPVRLVQPLSTPNRNILRFSSSVAQTLVLLSDSM